MEVANCSTVKQDKRLELAGQVCTQMYENEDRTSTREKTRVAEKRSRSRRSQTLLTCCVNLGQLLKEVCFKMSRVAPV